jgi:large subunit ribosomal protein L15
VVNLERLNTLEAGSVDPEYLVHEGIVRKGSLVKILGDGSIDKAMIVKAHKFSKSAKSSIEEAGGTVEILPLPFKGGRPPVKGNALANR